MGFLAAGVTLYTSRVVKPGSTIEAEEAPPLDSEAVRRAYRYHRLRREARRRRVRELRWASIRFWLVLAFALGIAMILAARTLGEIERVFGL